MTNQQEQTPGTADHRSFMVHRLLVMAPKIRRTPLRLIRAYLYDVWELVQEARFPLIGFVLLTLVNVVYLSFFYNHPQCEAFVPDHPQACLPLLQALFETVRMYVFEINLDWPAHDAVGQALFFITPFIGVALIFQSVLDFGRHLLDKGSRREAWQYALAKTFHNHVIICGLGRVSYRVMLQLLETGTEVVVIEQDWESDFVRQALKHRTPVVVGNARDPEILRRAGLFRARGLLAGSSNDLVNMEIALEAHQQRERRHEERRTTEKRPPAKPDDRMQIVLRIFNDELDANLERTFGPNSAFSSSALAAPTLAVAAVSRNIAHVLPLSDVVLGIVEITIARNSKLTGFASHIEDTYDVRLLQWLNSDGQWCWPHEGLRLEGDDVVLMMGTIDTLERVRQENIQSSKFDFLQAEKLQHPTEQFNKVIVCGLGKVGYRVVKEVYRQKPRPEVVVICGKETHRPFVEELESSGIRIIQGDARIPETLLDAGIEQAYSVAAVTSDNLCNIHIGLTARRIRSDVDLVIRVFSPILAQQLDRIFGAYTAFSTSALAAPTLAAATVEPGTSYALNLGGRLVSTLEIPVLAHDEFVGRSIHQIYKETRALVIGWRRHHERVLMPSPNLVLGEGEEIELLADIAYLSMLRPRAAQTERKTTTRRLFAPRKFGIVEEEEVR